MVFLIHIDLLRLGVFDDTRSVGNKFARGCQAEGLCFVVSVEHRVPSEATGQERSVDAERVGNVFQGDAMFRTSRLGHQLRSGNCGARRILRNTQLSVHVANCTAIPRLTSDPANEFFG